MATSVVTIKGQIVIPAGIRKSIGIKKGTRVFIEEKGGDIIVHPSTPSFYESIYGTLKGSGVLRGLEKSRQKEKEKEEKKIEKHKGS